MDGRAFMTGYPASFGRGLASCALLGVILLVSVGSTAATEPPDLKTLARQVRQAWTKAGARVQRTAVFFLERGRPRVLAIAPAKGQTGECLTVLAMAERHLKFSLSPAAPPDSLKAPPEAARQANSANKAAGRAGHRGGKKTQAERAALAAARSRMGVAQLEVCGPAQARLDKVEVKMASRRGAVQLLAVVHDQALPPVAFVVADRSPGPLSNPRGLGPSPKPAPLEERIAQTKRGARLDGAGAVVQVDTRASERGTGSLLLKLSAGCHRLTVLAGPAGENAASIDVDADARRAKGLGLLARDRSLAPDGRLDFCVGAVEHVRLVYVGAGAASKVAVLVALWPHPKGLPKGWGPRVRAGLAWALHRRRAPAVRDAPILQRLGGPGLTVVPIRLEPGACYLAALAPVNPPVKAVRLGARIGLRFIYDDATESPFSAAVSFCSESSRHGQLQVNFGSRSAWWVLAVWHLGGVSP